MKMYILVRDDVPLGHAMVAVAHASLACYLEYRDHPDVEAWLSGPFYKAVCKVDEREWSRAAEAGDFVVMTESALDGREVAMAFRPRSEWPKPFRFFRLYRE